MIAQYKRHFEADPAGRVKVANDFSVPNYADIFVIGDTAAAHARTCTCNKTKRQTRC